ncbi:alpha/beta hydrolase domain-containing protein [Sphingobium sp. H39-3-25]|uniref:alpha/beta hydrolase domain-containing protein n=1 Tax=Sphingobium arseniciresistens TaxID=3030834 RepID=UPI0023B938C6|nr:alpha/beta hydrolase domain-containing protein [Sphingobium arseniciresistens]
MRDDWKRTIHRGLIAGAMILATAGVAASAQAPVVRYVPGKTVLPLGEFDLASIGYRSDEYFFSGNAQSYEPAGPLSSDGRWTVKPGAKAPFTTRIVVVRPTDPAKFNGTVLVEWLNVTAGRDMPADWILAHREMTRKGYAYVGVSVQKMGVDGSAQNQMSGATAMPLTKVDPQRYGTLVHPGDAFSFDIFTQAGAALKSPGAGGLLGPLSPRRVMALGESQSATFLTTYINAIDPVARLYDGFFIHSRFGSGVALDSTRSFTGPNAIPRQMIFRSDLRVPVLALITETDLIGGLLPGYYGSRRPDDARLRVWEVPGAAHVDNYFLGGTAIDAGPGGSANLAPFFLPKAEPAGSPTEKSINPGMAHHYVYQAALAAFDRWVRTGKPPASAPLMEMAPGSTAEQPVLAVDPLGLTRGGVRSPWVDVPTMRITGVGNKGSFLATLGGIGERFDKATLAKLYPGGKADYLRRFTRALDKAIASGHILTADRQEIIEIAAINFDKS